MQANLLGSSLGLYIAYYLEKYYRSRREVSHTVLWNAVLATKLKLLKISRLYRPLDTDYLSSDDEDDFESGVQLLPTNNPTRATNGSSKSAPKVSRLADVWDEREELFDIGEESEDEEMPRPGPAPSPPGPKIVVTSSD